MNWQWLRIEGEEDAVHVTTIVLIDALGKAFRAAGAPRGAKLYRAYTNDRQHTYVFSPSAAGMVRKCAALTFLAPRMVALNEPPALDRFVRVLL